MSKIRRIIVGILVFIPAFVPAFMGGEKVFAAIKGKWITDIVVICADGRKGDAEKVIEDVCNRDWTLYEDRGLIDDDIGKGEESYERGKELLNPGGLWTIVHDRRQVADVTLGINFHIFEVKDLDDGRESGQQAKALVEKCAGAVILYDLEKDCKDFPTLKNKQDDFYKSSNDPMSAGVRFLTSFDWNNSVDFVRYYVNGLDDKPYDEACKDEHMRHLSNLAQIYHGYLEDNYAYKRDEKHNNRWGRTLYWKKQLLIRSSVQAFYFGMFIDPTGFDHKYAHAVDDVENAMRGGSSDGVVPDSNGRCDSPQRRSDGPQRGWRCCCFL